MSVRFVDGTFRVSVCKAGHITLELLDGEAVKAVCILSRSEAAGLAARLWGASEHGAARSASTGSRRTH